ncbi:hypothetical protein [Atlantibacter hermannii]|uniref:hypothetical protein n=1 Tax=Atlantibacter hermannii TaxID=565 RepID=UPI0028B2041E|nr:hypothetical protein [Atlantibacter hermannii]
MLNLSAGSNPATSPPYQGRLGGLFLLPKYTNEAHMSGVYFESKRLGDISCSHVKIGGIEAMMKQVGDRKVIKSHGRGNVRQVKAIVRALHKTIQ